MKLDVSLDVYLDLGNVAGLIALPPTLQLLAETGIEARWLPIQGIVPRPLSREPKQNPDDPIADYKRARWLAKQKFEMAELNRDCARLGLPLNLATLNYDARFTHDAWLALNQRGLSPFGFIQAVYEQRFQLGVALESYDAVSEVAAAHGLSSDSDIAEDIWVNHEQAYLELGIHDSPAYVLGSEVLRNEGLNGETFQGRQHLPLIRWRIEGEQGPPPL